MTAKAAPASSPVAEITSQKSKCELIYLTRVFVGHLRIQQVSTKLNRVGLDKETPAAANAVGATAV